MVFINKISLYEKCKISVRALDIFILGASAALLLLIVISVLIGS